MFFLEKYDLRYSKYAPTMCDWWGMSCCRGIWAYVMMAGTEPVIGTTTRCDLFQPATGWVTVTPISQVKRANAASGLAGVDIGVSAYGNGVNASNVAEYKVLTDAYTFSSDTWAAKTNGTGVARSNQAGGMNENAYLFVAGGSILPAPDDAAYLFNTDRFDETGNSWANSTNLSLNRQECPCVVVSTSVGFVSGGRKQTSTPSVTFNVYTNNDEFNLSAETYSVETALTVGRARHTLLPIDKKLYVATGGIKDTSGANFLVNDPATIEFDPATSVWTAKTDITHSMSRPGGSVDPNTLLGYTYGVDSFAAAWHQIYTPDTWTIGTLIGTATGVRQVMGESGNGN